MTTHVKAPVVIHVSFVHPPIPIRSFDFQATFDDYAGAPDAGHQCHGSGETALLAVTELYDDWEAWYGEEGDPIPNPLCAHRPMFDEDLGLHDFITLIGNYLWISLGLGS
jgi:hypothetical protein